MVVIYGAQQTGKSTLLNATYGTKFAVMAERTPGQTTVGIWVAVAPESDRDAPGAPRTLVVDLEGFDGRERGEQKNFERRAGLLALLLGDVVLYNVQAKNIHRNNEIDLIRHC